MLYGGVQFRQHTPHIVDRVAHSFCIKTKGVQYPLLWVGWCTADRSALPVTKKKDKVARLVRK